MCTSVPADKILFTRPEILFTGFKAGSEVVITSRQRSHGRSVLLDDVVWHRPVHIGIVLLYGPRIEVFLKVRYPCGVHARAVAGTK